MFICLKEKEIWPYMMQVKKNFLGSNDNFRFFNHFLFCFLGVEANYGRVGHRQPGGDGLRQARAGLCQPLRDARLNVYV